MPSRYLRLLGSLAVAAVVVIAIANRPEKSVPPTWEEWDDVSRAPGDGKPPRTPNPWFQIERAWPLGDIPRDAWRTAQLEARALADASTSRAAWQLRGPTNVGGRITDLAVDPRDANVAFAATAEGGVMRTRDGGQSWTMLGDQQTALSIGAIALDPSAPDVVYAGTGEVNPGGGSVAYGGVGVLRSSTGGDTWEALGLEETGSIGRVVVDPTDGDRILVAAMGHLWTPGPDRGVYRTRDGGTTWDRVLYIDDTTGCVDLIMRPDNPRVLFAAMWQRIRTPERYDYGGPSCAVWKSTDGGDTWNVVGGGLPAPGANGGRIGLTLCAAQPTRMYAVYADRTGYFTGLYRSDDGGAMWSRTTDSALSTVFSSYGWWFGNVRCHPSNPNTVWVLGLDFYRTTNGGASWSEVSGGMHVDHHALAFGSGLTPVIYEGNDGGIYRSTNGGTAWTMLPDQPITQVYRMGLDAQNANAIYLGGQDISTVRTLTGALDDWQTIFGGDGFQPLVHPQSSNRIWAQYQYGAVNYSSNGGSSFSSATTGIGSGDRKNWNAPHIQDPTNPDRRYFGTNKVYRNTSNTAWTAISGDLTGGPHQNQSGQVMGTLTTLGVSPLDGQVLWAGSDDGHVNVSTTGGTSWTDVSTGIPERWVTSVRCDPFDRETAYVTVSGFRWNEPLPHVLRTDDLGQSWTPITGNLPELPVNDLCAHPQQPGRLWVATDFGVYETTNGGAVWLRAGTGLPNIVVAHLLWDDAHQQIVAGTYGRSVWALDAATSTGVDEGAAVVTAGTVRPLYPNPSSSGTTVAWDLVRAGDVTIDVFTVSGRRVWRHLQDGAAKGPGQAFWDGCDLNGRPAPAGVYLVRVAARGQLVGSRTVVMVR